MILSYRVLLELLPGRLGEAACRLGGRQLALRPPQPLEELLQLAVETFRLQREQVWEREEQPSIHYFSSTFTFP